MKFRHFTDNQRIAIPWDDPKVVLIEQTAGGELLGYAYTVGTKLELLRGLNFLYVVWPGNSRTDMFELDHETRADAIDQLQAIKDEN